MIAFRGLPHINYDWNQSRRCAAQAEQWRRDGATVELRDLKYSFQLTAQGTPARDVNGHKIPKGPGQEKGIDVLVALTCLRKALQPDIDMVILASRDTDLVPTLDTLFDMRQENPAVAKIETVSWHNRNAQQEGNYAGGSLRPISPAASGTPTSIDAASKHHETVATTTRSSAQPRHTSHPRLPF